MLTSCGFVWTTIPLSGWSASVPIFYIQRTSELYIPHAPAPKVAGAREVWITLLANQKKESYPQSAHTSSLRAGVRTMDNFL